MVQKITFVPTKNNTISESMFDFLFYRENEPLIFTQANFWYFFGIIIVIYQFIYQRLAWRNLFLTVVSLYFYYLSGGWQMDSRKRKRQTPKMAFSGKYGQ